MLELVLIPYLGGAIGQSSVDITDPQIPGVTTTIDDTGDTFRLIAGVELTPHISIEAALFDLGEYTVDMRDGVDRVHASMIVDGLSVSAVGRLPLGAGWSLHARAGLARWTLEQTWSGTITTINGTERVSGTEPVYGAGLSLDIKKMRISLTAERYTDVGDPDITGTEDIQSITLGIVHRFR